MFLLFLALLLPSTGQSKRLHQALPSPLRPQKLRVAAKKPITLPGGSTPLGVVSRDGQHFAFLHTTTRGMAFSVDGVMGRRHFNTVSRLVFSPDSRRWAYLATRKSKGYLVIGKKQYGPFEKMEPTLLQFTADSKHCVALARKGNKLLLLVDGARLIVADEINPLGVVFAPHGRHFLFIARTGRSIRLREYGGPVSDVFASVTHPEYSADGHHVGFLAQTAKGEGRIVIDWHPRPLSLAAPFSLQGLFLSRDGRHYASLAVGQDRHTQLIVDGKVKASFGFFHNQSFSFAPNGQSYLYVAESGPGTNTMSLYRNDRRLEPAYDNVLQPPLRRPDKPEEFLMVVREAGTQGVRLVRNGAATGEVYKGMRPAAWSSTRGHSMVIAARSDDSVVLIVDDVALPEFSGGLDIHGIEGLAPRFSGGDPLLLSRKQVGNGAAFAVGSSEVAHYSPFLGGAGETRTSHGNLRLHFVYASVSGGGIRRVS
ncbi:MAG: hypothetical protein JWN14_2292, partial [Chthonomonadales bacterium]|nr:hypothetical protein [Chthonomonadales bacterium]